MAKAKKKPEPKLVIKEEFRSPVFELIRQLHAAMTEKGHSVGVANQRGVGYHEVYAIGRRAVGCYTRCKNCGRTGKNTFAEGLSQPGVSELCTGMKASEPKPSRGQVQRGRKSD